MKELRSRCRKSLRLSCFFINPDPRIHWITLVIQKGVTDNNVWQQNMLIYLYTIFTTNPCEESAFTSCQSLLSSGRCCYMLASFLPHLFLESEPTSKPHLHCCTQKEFYLFPCSFFLRFSVLFTLWNWQKCVRSEGPAALRHLNLPQYGFAFQRFSVHL